MLQTHGTFFQRGTSELVIERKFELSKFILKKGKAAGGGKGGGGGGGGGGRLNFLKGRENKRNLKKKQKKRSVFGGTMN